MEAEPAATVPIAVAEGLLTVLIGDSSLANMRSLTGGIVTTNLEVCLRVWFDDGTSGSVHLSQDTVLASAPYAVSVEPAPRMEPKLTPCVAP